MPLAGWSADLAALDLDDDDEIDEATVAAWEELDPDTRTELVKGVLLFDDGRSRRLGAASHAARGLEGAPWRLTGCSP